MQMCLLEMLEPEKKIKQKADLVRMVLHRSGIRANDNVRVDVYRRSFPAQPHHGDGLPARHLPQTLLGARLGHSLCFDDHLGRNHSHPSDHFNVNFVSIHFLLFSKERKERPKTKATLHMVFYVVAGWVTIWRHSTGSLRDLGSPSFSSTCSTCSISCASSWLNFATVNAAKPSN